MTKEDKNLLLNDLSGRLPYGVKVKCIYCFGDEEDKVSLDLVLTKIDVRCEKNLYWIGGEQLQENGINFNISDFASCSDEDDEIVKPYLFPLSSMTEEQKKFFKDKPVEIDKYGDIASKADFGYNSQYTDLDNYLECIDWLNANHFDYRGLIPRGLAIDCTGLNVYGKDPE